VKFFEICKQFSDDLVNEKRKIFRHSPIPRFSNWEVVDLNRAAEAEDIDSETWLFETANIKWDVLAGLIRKTEN
jgi:hypothetical protein